VGNKYWEGEQFGTENLDLLGIDGMDITHDTHLYVFK
jgi:hypothetical protein